MEKLIKAEAKRLGFSFCGFAPVQQTSHFGAYTDWAFSGMAVGMEYLTSERVVSSREIPQIILPTAKSVMVLGMGYPPNPNEVSNPHNKDHPTGKIAAFACQQDYHITLKEKCSQLVEFIQSLAPNLVNYKIFIDSGPVMEKDFSFLAGLGWIGKNSLFFHPETGSYCLLACIFLDVPFTTDTPSTDDPCGTCRICIDTCPTHCITENRTLDAGRCISYLTIENKEEIPDELRESMGTWVFGCDNCQRVCPINQQILSKKSKIRSSEPDIISGTINLLRGLIFTAEQFQEIYQHTPVTRATHDGFLRNLIIAAGNSASPILVETLIRLRTSHPSQKIRSHATWAIQKIQHK
jgi:epoxyqueuosine reductase